MEYIYGGQIHNKVQEETWGVFNSVQGFGTMIGPVLGGLISEVFRDVYYTIYASSIMFLFLALFYGTFFIINYRKENQHKIKEAEVLNQYFCFLIYMR